MPSDHAVQARLTAICAALPEAVVDDSHPPHLGFKVGSKNFAWYTVDEHGNGRTELHVRAEPGQNEALVASDGDRFHLPKYMKRYGWVSYYLDLAGRPVDWDEVGELVADSFRLQAPKRLGRQV